MSEIKLIPALGDCTSYIFAERPQPWTMNYGTIKRSYININGTLCVDFYLDIEDVINSPDWSVEKNGILLEIKDKNNVPIMENWLIFTKKTKNNFTLLLRANK